MREIDKREIYFIIIRERGSSLYVDDAQHEQLSLVVLLTDGHDGAVVASHVHLDGIHAYGHGGDLLARVHAPQSHRLIAGARDDKIVV